jgi:intracellular sulfur oxidation DsrE/DsrF family protein
MNRDEKDDLRLPERRSFLTTAQQVAPLAALVIGGAAIADGKSKADTNWRPAHHGKDDWLDETSAKHRLVFDTVDANGFGEALLYAANYIASNSTDYSVKNTELAVVIIARHGSTPFAYNDVIWAKYGSAITDLIKFNDPKSKQAPASNVFRSTEYGELLSNRGVTIDNLVKQGVRFGVCGMATQGIAGVIANSVKGDRDKIHAELLANLTPNSLIVPAGIVAVSRAQERGYTFVRA